jgi:hypothetical protein
MPYDDATECLLNDPKFAEYMEDNCSLALLSLKGCYSEFRVFNVLAENPLLKNVRSPGDGASIKNYVGIDRKTKMMPDFFYEYKGRTFSHEHKTIKNEKSSAPLFRCRVSQKWLAEDKKALSFPFYNLYDIVSVDLKFKDSLIFYLPVYRIPLHKTMKGRHQRDIKPKMVYDLGYRALSDALDDIVANESTIIAQENEFKDELGFSAYSGASQKGHEKTGLERFFIL